jgi:TonB family protein
MTKTATSVAKCVLMLSLVLTPLAAVTRLFAQNSDTGPIQHGNLTIYKVGGDVSAPVLIHSVEPEYTAAARNAHASGTVTVTLWVDVNGNPSHVRVIHGIGVGLDEKSVEAVHQYKYKPAMKDGKPVMVETNVEVQFHQPAN